MEVTKEEIKVNGRDMSELSYEELSAAFKSLVLDQIGDKNKKSDTSKGGTTKTIFFRESFVQSVLADITSFTFMLFSIWFNYNFVGGSYFLNGIILIMFLMFLVGKTNAKNNVFNSIEDLEKHIEEIKKDMGK